MTDAAARKRTLIIGWMMFIIGVLICGDGVFQLMNDNGSRLGQASFGAILIILSSVFFAAARRKKE